MSCLCVQAFVGYRDYGYEAGDALHVVVDFVDKSRFRWGGGLQAWRHELCRSVGAPALGVGWRAHP